MNKPLKRIHPGLAVALEIVCLVLIAGAVYFSTLDHAFHLDDKQNIWNDPNIQISELSFDALANVVSRGNMRSRPLPNISFALNHYFNGLDVRGYHAVNILVHLMAGVMLFFFIRTTLALPVLRDRHGPAGLVPFFAALIWLLHPVNIQSVTYIVQRMNSMAALFFISAMYFYARARLTPGKVKKGLLFFSSFLAAFLAFGSKENAITLPAFILLYEWYFLQDLRLRISRKQVFWLAFLGLVFLAVLYAFLGSSPLDKLAAGYSGRPFTLSERLLTQPRVVLHYLTLLVFPHPARLNLDYDFPLSYSLVSPAATILAIILIMGMLGIAVYGARARRLYSFCILWIFGNLVIESSTIPLEIAFEHRTYLPFMMGVLLLVMLFHQAIKKRLLLAALLVVVSLLFSYWTYERNKVWKDELTLWTDSQKKSPDKARPNQHLGVALSDAGRIDEALPILERALYLYEQEMKLQKIVSSRLTAFHLQNLGIIYKKKGEYNKAIFYLDKAIREFYFSSKTHFHLAQSYEKIWRLDEAIYHYTKALEFAMHHSTDLFMQANVRKIRSSLEKVKKLKRARDEREKSVRGHTES